MSVNLVRVTLQRLLHLLSHNFVKKLFLLILFVGLGLSLPWIIVSWTTEGRLYRDVDSVPENYAGLLLGTTPSVNGVNNIFFSTRIEATKALYERGKIRHILVS